MNNLNKSILYKVVFLLGISNLCFSQFLTLEGKESSGIIASIPSTTDDSKYSQSNITYNFTSDLLTLEGVKQGTTDAFTGGLSDSYKKRCISDNDADGTCYNTSKLDKWSLSIGLSDGIFDPLNQSEFKASLSKEKSFLVHYKINKDKSKKIRNFYQSYSFEPVISVNRVGLIEGRPNVDSVFVRRNAFNIESGVSFSTSKQLERRNYLGGPAYGFTNFIGFEINSIDHLSSSQVCQNTRSITIDTSSVIQQRCSDVMLGNPVHTAVGRLNADIALPIGKPLSGSDSGFRFRENQIYFISRGLVEIRPHHIGNEIMADWRIGLTLANANRQTLVGFIFSIPELISKIKNSVRETINVNPVQIQISLPISQSNSL